MINLKPIKRGDTWVWNLAFWQDDARTTSMDVSGHSFAFTAKDVSGSTVIALTNTDFVQTSTSVRKVTISSTSTTGYPLGELSYDLVVTIPGGEKYTWMEGNVKVVDNVN